jgi:hypothetical protein
MLPAREAARGHIEGCPALETDYRFVGKVVRLFAAEGQEARTLNGRQFGPAETAAGAKLGRCRATIADGEWLKADETEECFHEGIILAFRPLAMPEAGRRHFFAKGRAGAQEVADRLAGV